MREDGGKTWLPPGQVATGRFPRVGEGPPDPALLVPDAWRLTIGGLVGRPLVLTLPEVLALPAEDLEVDLHCVTGWSRRAVRFRGPRLATVLEAAEVDAGARFVRLVAVSERGHDTSLPRDIALGATWLVHSLDGGPLPIEHGGPVRTVTPSRYLYKSLKWLRSVECLADDRLGYWERESGYHNRGDPWSEERYVTGGVRPEDVARLRSAVRLGAFRAKQLLGVDLRGWDPRDRDLHGLQLRSCDLRGARLDGVDLSDANLTRCDLRGASLRGASLRRADIEGADLRGADLEGADLRGARMTATRLADQATRVAGLRVSPDHGLLEGEDRWLASQGVEPS